MEYNRRSYESPVYREIKEGFFWCAGFSVFVYMLAYIFTCFI